MAQLTPDWSVDACSESRLQETAVSTSNSTQSRHYADVMQVLPTVNVESLGPNNIQLRVLKFNWLQH